MPESTSQPARKLAYIAVAVAIGYLVAPWFLEALARSELLAETVKAYEQVQKRLEDPKEDSSRTNLLDQKKHAIDARDAIGRLSSKGTPTLNEIIVTDYQFKETVKEYGDSPLFGARGWEYFYIRANFPNASIIEKAPSSLLQPVLSFCFGMIGFCILKIVAGSTETFAQSLIGIAVAGARGALVVLLLYAGVHVMITEVMTNFSLFNPFSVAVLGVLAGMSTGGVMTLAVSMARQTIQQVVNIFRQ